MKRVVTIIGSGMMGSALAFPAAENGHEVRLVGSPLDRDIIDCCVKSNRHPKFDRDFRFRTFSFSVSFLNNSSPAKILAGLYGSIPVWRWTDVFSTASPAGYCIAHWK